MDTSSVCFADSFPSKGKPFGEHHQQLDKSEFARLSNNHHSAGIANTLPKMSSASSSSFSFRLAI